MEEKIGIWIDNKPLYKQTFVKQLSNKAQYGQYTIDEINITGVNCETIVDIESKMGMNSDHYVVDGNYHTESTALSLITHIVDNKIIKVRNNQSWAGDYKIYVTLLYTKTTD